MLELESSSAVHLLSFAPYKLKREGKMKEPHLDSPLISAWVMIVENMWGGREWDKRNLYFLSRLKNLMLELGWEFVVLFHRLLEDWYVWLYLIWSGCPPVFIPARVVQALQHHFDEMGVRSRSNAGGSSPQHGIVLFVVSSVVSSTLKRLSFGFCWFASRCFDDGLEKWLKFKAETP